MKPGPELDALVAEKVMGWHRSKVQGWWDLPDGKPVKLDDWSPSTSIADAWEVVESSNMWMNMVCNNKQDMWTVQFAGMQFGETASTAPLAICLAALWAVGAME